MSYFVVNDHANSTSSKLHSFLPYSLLFLCGYILLVTLGVYRTLPYGSTDGQLQRTEVLMTAPVMLGMIDPSRKYAVFSSTSARNISESMGFIFQLPLTALAWKRIGFESLIIIVGSANAWNFDPLLHTVLSRVRELDAVVMFVEVHPTNSVMISQVRTICFCTATLCSISIFPIISKTNSKEKEMKERVFV